MPKTSKYINVTQPLIKMRSSTKENSSFRDMTCICKEMRTVTLCINFSMNFKNSSTWQANSASTADNKLPIEPHTLCAILMCHIKSEHKASATGPTQMCFFQIPPRSLLSFIILHTSWTYSETLSTDSDGFLPTKSTSNLMPLYPSKIDLQTPARGPRLPQAHFHGVWWKRFIT